MLNRSRRTISRYVNKGLLTPEKVKNEQGVIEYKFHSKEIEKFNLPKKVFSKDRPGKHIGHKTPPDMAHNDTEVITLLKDQLKEKGKEITRLHKKIDRLIDRQHETNVLIGSLQNKVLKLEHKTNDQDTGHQESGTGTKIRQFIDRLLGKK